MDANGIGVGGRSFENTLIDEEPAIQAMEVCVRAHAKYERKYHKNKEGESSGKYHRGKSRRSRSRSRGRKRGSSRRRRSPSNSSRSGRSSDDGSDGEVFYRGKWKFQIVDGVEYVITKNKRWRTDQAPPGDCDHCGGRHWEWLCPKKVRK